MKSSGKLPRYFSTICGGVLSIARWKLRNVPRSTHDSEDALDFCGNRARCCLGNRDNAHSDKEHNWLCGYYCNWGTGYSVGNDMGVGQMNPKVWSTKLEDSNESNHK